MNRPRPAHPHDSRPQAPARPHLSPGRGDAGARPGDGTPLMEKPTYDPHRRLVLLVSIPLAITTMVFVGILVYHHLFGGVNAFRQVHAPLPTVAVAEETTGEAERSAAGVYDIDVRYVSDIVETNGGGSDGPGIVEVPLAWNDAWFSENPDDYNHGLATACATLCAVVNSESFYYGGKTDVDFVAEALGALGFTDIQTSSFEERSKATDEVMGIFTGDTDVVAYVLARKELAQGGQLVFVGARGTYGSEWLSNFNFLDSEAFAGESDHTGFKTAEAEIEKDLEEYCLRHGVTEDDKVPVTGHSRGGAVANLLAADLDFRAQADYGPFALAGIYAYTFAAPRVTTRGSDAQSPLYHNIFNVVNPTDLVARIPFAGWGYRRYGVTVELPEAGDPDFSELYGRMQDRRAETTGYRNDGDPITSQDAGALDDFEAHVLEAAPDLESLQSFDSLIGLLGAFGHLNVGHVVASHYPDTYLAWLQTLDPRRVVLEEE